MILSTSAKPHIESPSLTVISVNFLDELNSASSQKRYREYSFTHKDPPAFRMYFLSLLTFGLKKASFFAFRYRSASLPRKDQDTS